MRVRVLRRFQLGPDRVAEIGHVVEVSDLFGVDLVHGGKAEQVDASVELNPPDPDKVN